MPPKAKITKEMILDAAFEIVRTEGYENINARKISQKLNCSTQPVLYYFATIEEIKNEIYQRADNYHAAYISNIQGKYENPMLEIGLLYTKFAVEEKELFRLLLQSDKSGHSSFFDLINEDGTDTNSYQVKEIFTSFFLMVHGLASMLANNSMNYDEIYTIQILKNTLKILLDSIKEDRE